MKPYEADAQLGHPGCGVRLSSQKNNRHLTKQIVFNVQQSCIEELMNNSKASGNYRAEFGGSSE